jgi:hypothetical protein
MTTVYLLASGTAQGPCMGDLVREGRVSKHYTHDSSGEVDGWEWTNHTDKTIYVKYSGSNKEVYRLEPNRSTDHLVRVTDLESFLLEI